MTTPPEHAADGEWYQISYAEERPGSMPALDFLNELKAEPNRVRDYVAIVRLFQLYATKGKISNKEHFKKVEGTNPTLFEFKHHQVRVLAFTDGKLDSGKRLMVLTHGFIKKADKTPPAEIARAQRIRVSHTSQRNGLLHDDDRRTHPHLH